MEAKKVLNCEVLVVGGGNAGLVCAIEAKNRGANVLVIEKAPVERRGGNSRLTGGVWRVAFDDPKKDIVPLFDLTSVPVPIDKIDMSPYPKDMFYKDMMQVSQGLSEKKWAEIMVEKSLATVKWMAEQGAKFNVGARMQKKGDRYFQAPRDIVLQSVNLGEGLVEQLYGIAINKGIPIVYETAAQSLIVNADGDVCGVTAKSNEGMIQINAHGVVLACGGFEANPEMRRRYLGEGWDLCKLRGTRYNTGDGLKMAMDIGAQSAGHWGGCHASVVSEDSPLVEAETVGPTRYAYPYCIMVNTNGDRFINEGEDIVSFTYAKTGREIAKQPGTVAFQIFDAKVKDLLWVEYKGAVGVESNSLEDLAAQCDINVENFVKTVKQFNASISNDGKPFLPEVRDGRRTHGLTPDKTNWAQTIDTPPFLAYAVVRGLTFAYGGIKINEKTQVIDTRDHPIEGLYAVGEMPGGLFYHNYLAGSGLTKGSITGRIAAEQAVTRSQKIKGSK